MDSYGFINSIQVEKTNALIRYKQFNNISKLFRTIEVFIAVALFSWFSTRLPAVFKVSGEYMYACSCYVFNQHVVFLVGNVIVVVCYVLSGYTELGMESDCSEVGEDDPRIKSTNGFKTNESVLNTEAEVSEDIRSRHTNNHITESGFNIEPEVLEDKQNEYAAVKLRTEAESDAEAVIKQAVKRIERFNRTQSAKLSMEISMKPRRELRRSVTERRRSVVAGEGDGDGTTSSSVETVERLSNEEFRLAVEAFISKQQSLLKQQGM